MYQSSFMWLFSSNVESLYLLKAQPRICWLSTIITQRTLLWVLRDKTSVLAWRPKLTVFSFFFFPHSMKIIEGSGAAEMSNENWTSTSYSYQTLLSRFRRSFCDSMAFKIPASKLDFTSTWQQEWVNMCMNIALYLHEFKMAANAVESDCPSLIVWSAIP